MEGGVVYAVDNNIASIAYQPEDYIIFLTLDEVENYCENLSFTWGDGQIYDDWQVSTDVDALGNHASA